MWDPPLYGLLNKQLYLNTLTKQPLNYFLGSNGILVILEDFGGHFGHFEHLGAF